MSERLGALPMQTIRQSGEAGFITGLSPENVNPASLDLVLSEEIYRIEGIFQPRPGEKVRDILELVGARKHDPRYPLELHVPYLARLVESFKLPSVAYSYNNPKSSIGRNDLQVRVVADRVPRFDSLEVGFSGEVWLVMQPKSFPVLAPPGESLNQARFFTGDTRFDQLDLELSFEKEKLLWRKSREPFSFSDIKISDRDGSIILTIDLTSDVVGWECVGTNQVLDLSKRNYYNPEDFFRPVTARNGRVQLKKDRFYLFLTREWVRVPPGLACEMVAMDVRSGEFRTHYAGYIDPGWGYGKDGDGCGRPLVMEIRPFEDLVLRDNQPVAKIRFEQMTERPKHHYDELDSSHYTEETSLPGLSKHFTDP